MAQIGNKIYFDTITGSILAVIGERTGNVRETTTQEDVTIFPILAEKEFDCIQLNYGERAEDFKNFGSGYVNVSTKELIIYPRLNITVNKKEIISDGIDTTIINISVPEDSEIKFSVNDSEVNTISTINKNIDIEFNSLIVGTYIIDISTLLYGQSKIVLEVVNA